MQRVRTDVSPETVKASLSGSGLGPSDLKDTAGYAETGVGSDNFDAGDPFGGLTTDLGSDLGAVLECVDILVQVVDLVAGSLGESGGGSQVSKEVTVGGEDVKLILGLLLVLCNLLTLNVMNLETESLRHRRMARHGWSCWCKRWRCREHPRQYRCRSC